MRALVKNQTWEVIQRPHNKVPVGCGWVFTVKYKADGAIERYKARGWLLRDTHRHTELTTKKHLLR